MSLPGHQEACLKLNTGKVIQQTVYSLHHEVGVKIITIVVKVYQVMCVSCFNNLPLILP